MNFLFWNIYKKDLSELIYQLCVLHDIDVLMLCECTIKPDTLLSWLNSNKEKYYFSPNKMGQKINIFTRIDTQYMTSISDENRITARNLALPNKKSITLVIAHLASKMNQNDSSQLVTILELERFIHSVEQLQGHRRTVLCGDLNINPFEAGMIQAICLHSVMEKRIALKMSRTIQGKDYPYFYNPMWGFLGDLGRGAVSGTHYYSPAQHVNYHWHLFDQVIMRPEIIAIFDDEKLDIITKTDTHNFLSKNGIINKAKFSDHLPIKFTLNI